MTRQEINAVFDGDGWYAKYGQLLVDLLNSNRNGLTLKQVIEKTALTREVALETLRKLAYLNLVDNRTTVGIKGLTLYEPTDAALRSVKDKRELPKKRKCLSCENPFFSSYAGNRICQYCKDAEAFDEAGAMAI